MNTYFPEEIEHMIQSFLFTYPEVDCIAMRSTDPKFVNYMKSITVRTVKIQGADVEFYMDGILHNEESPTIKYGDSFWYKNGKCHRDDDKPAFVDHIGNQCWYKNGKLHRDDDKPAIVYWDGDQFWYKNGKLHREGDKPASVYQNGDLRWYKDGNLHRDEDKPAIIYQNGDKHWYKDGYPYRENDKPTVVVDVGTIINQQWNSHL